MARQRKSRHTGHTNSGSVKDVRVDRIGRVTIYQRGKAFYLYYREAGKTVRQKIEGNLASARIAASKVTASLEEGRASPFGFTKVEVRDLVAGFLGYCADVQAASVRTRDRYRAALGHLVEFAQQHLPHPTADQVTGAVVEDFVRWMRQRKRTRNGSPEGTRTGYSPSGIRFVLSACRTAFNWAQKRRYLPPYEENPFNAFPIDKVFKREPEATRIFSPEEQAAFFEACDEWQLPIFLVLGVYGLRVGELTHLLVSDVDLDEGTLRIQSKPEMCWSVKTQRERVLPVLPALDGFFRRLTEGRGEGLLFLNRNFVLGEDTPKTTFVSRQALALRLQQEVDAAIEWGEEDERAHRRTVTSYLRQLGQIPEKRIRQEFMKVTRKIGCPEITRAHSLRHLFSTRAQEQGMNPLLVQGLLGHTTLDMTSQYTHFRMDAKRQAVSRMLQDDPALRGAVERLGKPNTRRG